MGLFGLAAPLMMPADEFLSFPVPIRCHPEGLILNIMERDSLKRETVHGQARLFHQFPDGDVSVGFPLFGTNFLDRRSIGCPYWSDTLIFSVILKNIYA
jgi:hypothetical protein